MIPHALLMLALSPDLSALHRFPPIEISHAMSDVAWEGIVNADDHLAKYPNDRYWITMREHCEWCHDCWLSLHIASIPSKSVAIRASYLNDLRSLLGPERWGGGNMPPPLPLWLYRWRD